MQQTNAVQTGHLWGDQRQSERTESWTRSKREQSDREFSWLRISTLLYAFAFAKIPQRDDRGSDLWRAGTAQVWTNLKIEVMSFYELVHKGLNFICDCLKTSVAGRWRQSRVAPGQGRAQRLGRNSQKQSLSRHQWCQVQCFNITTCIYLFFLSCSWFCQKCFRTDARTRILVLVFYQITEQLDLRW